MAPPRERSHKPAKVLTPSDILHKTLHISLSKAEIAQVGGWMGADASAQDGDALPETPRHRR